MPEVTVSLPVICIQALLQRFALVMDTIAKVDTGLRVVAAFTRVAAFLYRIARPYIVHEVVDDYH